MEIYSISTKNRREYMEDCCRYITFQTKESNNRLVICAAIADGVSSCAYSDEAAKMAVGEILRKSIDLEEGQLVDSAAMAAWSNSAMRETSSLLSMSFPDARVGTTLSFVVVFGQFAIVAGCGDSPAYLVDGKEISQILDLDHEPDDTNVLTSWLGNPSLQVDAHTKWLQMDEGTQIAFGSDGAFGNLSLKAISRELTISPSIIECAEALLESAAHTTTDNQALIILKW
jgi:serine/threonine protein phosphatase PrpC